MKRLCNILALMLVLLAANCCQKRLPEVSSRLNIYVRFPRPVEVKAEIGDVAAEELNKETYIKNLTIWVFLSDDFDAQRPSGYCLGALGPSQGSDPLTGNENQYYIEIDPDIARAHPNVDVYAIANTESSSINSVSLSLSPSRDKLDAYLMQGNYYTVKSDGTPSHTSVPAGGLPFAAVGKSMQMTGKYPVMQVETITLTRLVSKFRIVMSQLVDAAGPVMNFTITGLSLDAGLIASAEYVFNDSDEAFKISKAGTDADYVQYELAFPPSSYATVAANASPQEYAYYSGMTAQEYETLVLGGIEAGVLTDVGKCYLRESDKGLTGKITYTIDGVPGSAAFSMQAGDAFSRNHSWIVYIYFLSDEMKFSVNWTPWLDGGSFNLTQ